MHALPLCMSCPCAVGMSCPCAYRGPDPTARACLCDPCGVLEFSKSVMDEAQTCIPWLKARVKARVKARLGHIATLEKFSCSSGIVTIEMRSNEAIGEHRNKPGRVLLVNKKMQAGKRETQGTSG